MTAPARSLTAAVTRPPPASQRGHTAPVWQRPPARSRRQWHGHRPRLPTRSHSASLTAPARSLTAAVARPPPAARLPARPHSAGQTARGRTVALLTASRVNDVRRFAAVQHERGPRNSTLRRQVALYLKENPEPHMTGTLIGCGPSVHEALRAIDASPGTLIRQPTPKVSRPHTTTDSQVRT